MRLSDSKTTNFDTLKYKCNYNLSTFVVCVFQVLVTYVVDASHYFVRLLSARHNDMTTKDLSPQYSQLQMELAVWYTNLANQKRHSKSCDIKKNLH